MIDGSSGSILSPISIPLSKMFQLCIFPSSQPNVLANVAKVLDIDGTKGVDVLDLS